jgi:hypothetical protein
VWLRKLLSEYSISVLTRVAGPKREEVAGGRRKLDAEELYYFISSPSTIGS